MASPFARAEHRVMRNLVRAMLTVLFTLAFGLLAILWLSVGIYWMLEPHYGPLKASLVLAIAFALMIAAVLIFGAVRRRLRRTALTPDPLLFVLGSLYEFRESSPREAQYKTAEAVLAEMLADLVRRSEARK